MLESPHCAEQFKKKQLMKVLETGVVIELQCVFAQQLRVLENEPQAKRMKVTEQQPVVQIIGNEEVLQTECHYLVISCSSPLFQVSIIKDDTKKKVALGKEAAIETEVRAAREKAVVHFETRMKQFWDLLEEKQISAFSTWEKELHKIVFDPR